ncbi:MAG: pyrroline-5-carboxylate reductase [Pseudomonadota bacterium]
MPNTVLLVGCGNMGFAMLKGWLAQDPELQAHVVEPADALRSRASEAGAKAVASADALPDGLAPDLVFLAVKPQVMAEVVPAYTGLAGGTATFVSVAAGTMMASLAAMLPGPTPLIRCMPNTPAAIGAGMMVCCANDHTPEDAKTLASTLLSASGAVEWIDDEALMDAVTAVSGSGPAYVFHLIECLAQAGAEMGLPSDLAEKMALQTVMGAGRLAAESDTPAGTLREQVTSPGGTTAAALGVLMSESGLQPLMTQAVAAARDRGIELGKT